MRGSKATKKVSWIHDGMYYCNPLGWPLGRDRGLGAEEGPSADVSVGAERTGHWLVEHQLLLPEHLRRPEGVWGDGGGRCKGLVSALRLFKKYCNVVKV